MGGESYYRRVDKLFRSKGKHGVLSGTVLETLQNTSVKFQRVCYFKKTYQNQQNISVTVKIKYKNHRKQHHLAVKMDEKNRRSYSVIGKGLRTTRNSLL